MPLYNRFPARVSAAGIGADELDTVTDDPQAEYRAAALTGAATLPQPVLPMALLHPELALAWYLQNPLLLAKEPRRLAATKAALEAGEYSPARVREVALLLQSKRNRMNSSLAGEPLDRGAESELLDLCAHPALASERSYLRRRVFGARPSEYAWLRKPLEEAIIRARS